MAILLCEQYYDFAEELAGHYLVMVRGDVIAAGPGSEMQAKGHTEARGDLKPWPGRRGRQVCHAHRKRKARRHRVRAGLQERAACAKAGAPVGQGTSRRGEPVKS